MPPQLNILVNVADPTGAYILFLAGGVLVVFECLRPGTVWVGVAGAVLITISLDALANWYWTWYGLSLLGLALCLGFLGVSRRTLTLRSCSGVAFGLGSAVLIDEGGSPGIHPVAATLGMLFAFSCNWLLWIARRVRLAKRTQISDS
jgi:membrane-bound serine protease (ClpP class)